MINFIRSFFIDLNYVMGYGLGMELIMYLKDGLYLIEPENISDFALFRHCSGGLQAVTESEYRLNTEPVLEAHGICRLAIRKVKKEKQ